jgi:hypothetical protein
MAVVQFEVAYQLGEYRQFVLEHVHTLKGKRPGILTRIFVSILVVPAFFLKASKVGRCSFTVDATGIARSSASGEAKILWSDVTAVHRYSPGLLIEIKEGAVPFPYRCLTALQRSWLDGLVASWETDIRGRGNGDV